MRFKTKNVKTFVGLIRPSGNPASSKAARETFEQEQQEILISIKMQKNAASQPATTITEQIVSEMKTKTISLLSLSTGQFRQHYLSSFNLQQ